MVKLKGIEFKDPIIIASGVIPDVPEYIESFCNEFKPSAITTKTFTLYPLEPHNPPTLIKVHDGCYLNAIGLGNPGIDVVNKINTECPLIVSVSGKDVNEIVEAVSKVNNPRAVMIELNLSSPNRAGYGQSMAQYTAEIVKSVKGATRLPVFVKFGPWDNIIELVGEALSNGADGISLINTIRGMAIDVYTSKPILSYGTGGLSGKCIHPLAVRIIRDVYAEYSADIIGMGGVFDWVDALELIEVGAKLVAVGTAIIDKGAGVIDEIRKGLLKYLEEKGLKIEDLIGIAVRK